MTAYILTSLLEAGELTTNKAVSEAAFCLVNDKSDDPYTLALKSYALALAGAPEAASLLTQLLAKATTTTDGLYWELPATDGKQEMEEEEGEQRKKERRLWGRREKGKRGNKKRWQGRK